MNKAQRMNVIVVGSGIAGLTAALHTAEAGHRTTLVTKDALGGGCTVLAQGGVAGVYGPGDSPELHAADTLNAGAGLSDPTAVDVLVDEGSSRIAELIARGVEFDRDADGMLLLGREAAHTHSRIVHAGGDATGAAISSALVAQVRTAAIDVIEHALLVDLLSADTGIYGIRMLRGNAYVDIHADAVILATGGSGQLYTHTTNPLGATGDGIAAAIRAGAAVADLEFVQFHPTVLDVGDAFLISEAVRGEGAALIDDEGRRFTFDAHPDGELAPRDVVARAVARQAAAQGTSVRLDATMIGGERLAKRFPTIDRVIRERGFEWAREPIPVTPAAHYLMGGVATNLDGRTSLPGLFAVGEVARTGVHGANRLASNSILEGAVFAARAAAAIGTPTFGSHFPPFSEFLSDEKCDLNQRLSRTALNQRLSRAAPNQPFSRAALNQQFSRAALQQLMWESVGLLRTTDGLRDALVTIHAWRAATPVRATSSGSPTPATRAAHEDRNLLALADATASAALARTESVGAHHLTASLALIGS